MNAIIFNPTAAGQSIINTNTSTTGINIYTYADSGVGRSRVVSSHSQKNIESAVYGHIRAVRALGRRAINTVEISKALGLPLADVDKTLQSLKEKGVRIIS